MMGQVLILVSCLLYIDYLYHTTVLPEFKAQNEYTRTQCFVMSKKLSRKKGFVADKYRAEFLLSFAANGTQYNRWVSNRGLDMSYTRDSSDSSSALTHFRVGANYQCWYNPQDPEMVLLVPRKSSAVLMPLLIPAIIGMVAFYFLLINLMQFWFKLKNKKQDES